MILSETELQQVQSILITKIVSLEAIYLFGSGATAAYSEDSDVDLAIKAAEPLKATLIWDLQNDLADALGREVDLIDLSSADTVMRMQVVANGLRFYTANRSKSEAWDSLVFSMYLKFNDDRKEILEEIEQSGTIYG